MSSGHKEVSKNSPGNNGKSLLQFHYESNSSEILPVLEKRLPKSANIYNMCRVYDKFKKPEEMAFYVMTSFVTPTKLGTLNSELDTWVLATYFREDYGMRYAVSAPPNALITSEIQEAFVNCPFIDWNKQYHFACIDFEISSMIYEISTKIVGNSVTSMPCKIYCMRTTEEASNLDVRVPDTFSGDLTLKPMDRAKGAEFVCNTWKYAIPQKTGIAIEKLLGSNKSMGLHDKDGNIVCGMLINDCGLMGMLHTIPEHRGNGYATLVAKSLIKSFATESQAVPCSAVEVKNHQSVAFHEKLGMSISHYADFIKYVPQSW